MCRRFAYRLIILDDGNIDPHQSSLSAVTADARWIHWVLLAGGVIGFVEADFAGLAFSALLFLALAVAIRSNFLIALVPLALAGALGSSTGYMHAVYMLTVTEPTITIAFFAILAGAAYVVSQHAGPAYQQLAITFARVSLILVNFGFWIGSLWGDYPGET
jgi:hypothetical protein